MSRIDAVYLIAHPTFESEKIQRLLEHFKLRFPSLTSDKIIISAPSWGSTLSAEDCFAIYDPWLLRPGWPCFTWKNRGLLKGEISLVLNFFNAMKDAVEKGHKLVLIFESDIYLRNDFEIRLNKLLEILEARGSDSWDYVSLSDGIATHTDKYTGDFMEQSVYPSPNQFPFRCTDSMLFQTNIFKKIMGTLFPFRDCLDWELNFQFILHNGKALWAEPHLVEQGTMKHRDITTLPS